MLTRLTSVVRNTTLETISASFRYLVARIADVAAAGIAESRITTDRNTPVISRALTIARPIASPTPMRRTQANHVVGKEAILTRERLCPRTSKTSGMAIMAIKSSELTISSGTLTFRKFSSKPRTAA